MAFLIVTRTSAVEGALANSVRGGCFSIKILHNDRDRLRLHIAL